MIGFGCPHVLIGGRRFQTFLELAPRRRVFGGASGSEVVAKAPDGRRAGGHGGQGMRPGGRSWMSGCRNRDGIRTSPTSSAALPWAPRVVLTSTDKVIAAPPIHCLATDWAKRPFVPQGRSWPTKTMAGSVHPQLARLLALPRRGSNVERPCRTRWKVVIGEKTSVARRHRAASLGGRFGGGRPGGRRRRVPGAGACTPPRQWQVVDLQDADGSRRRRKLRARGARASEAQPENRRARVVPVLTTTIPPRTCSADSEEGVATCEGAVRRRDGFHRHAVTRVWAAGGKRALDPEAVVRANVVGAGERGPLRRNLKPPGTRRARSAGRGNPTQGIAQGAGGHQRGPWKKAT